MINLTIIEKTLGDRTATISLFESGQYKKALVRCARDENWNRAFWQAISHLKKNVVINLYTNKSDRAVLNTILKETNKPHGHQIFLLKAAPGSLDRFEWLAYEIALQNGTDEILFNEILK